MYPNSYHSVFIAYCGIISSLVTIVKSFICACAIISREFRQSREPYKSRPRIRRVFFQSFFALACAYFPFRLQMSEIRQLSHLGLRAVQT